MLRNRRNPAVISETTPRRASTCNAFGKVFEFGDVENGTAREVLGETVGVQVEADFDGVFADERHVVIGDVVMRAVRKADAERFERFGLEQFADLFGRDHGRTITDGLSRFNHRIGFYGCVFPVYVPVIWRMAVSSQRVQHPAVRERWDWNGRAGARRCVAPPPPE